MIKLKGYAGKSDQGPYLQVNEDSFEVDLANDVYMILDGFGGAGIGDRVVSKIKDNIKNFYTRINGNPEATLPFYYSHKYLLEGNALINSAYFTHKLLCKENEKVDLSSRGGASSIIGALSENILTLISVGNCVAYLYRKGNLTKLFQEDALYFVNRDDFKSYLQTSPLSAFGLFEDIHLEIKEIKVLSGDFIILLTDGAYSRIKKDELKYIIEKVENNINKIDTIFEFANKRGNLDNQSAVILQF